MNADHILLVLIPSTIFQDPPWSKQVKGFRRLSEEELKDYPGRE